jgi:hypothetical protein
MVLQGVPPMADRHPNSRSFFLTLLLGLLILFSCLALTNSVKTFRVSEATEYKLRDGMAEQDVISIIGFPPGDYRTREVLYGGPHRIAIPFDRAEKCSVRTWTTNEGQLIVTFDEEGKVCGTAFNEPKVSIGWFEEILVKLGVRQPRSWCLN